MANMVEGRITDDPIAKLSRSGEFNRPDSTFRGQILKSEVTSGRYHLYVSYACPWAHRTLITRNLKKLEKVISVSVSDAYMGEKGWTFSDPKDPRYLAVLYVSSSKSYTGKISVPVLWDSKTKTILNNESSEIIRILNSSFSELEASSIDLYPEELRARIDEINAKVYDSVNNGVYKTGFAASQSAYEMSFDSLFKALSDLEEDLSKNQFLAGEFFTEADIRLFTTLVRFDPVYYGHFKCNFKRIEDYPHLQNYLKSIYQIPEIKSTCHFDHIKEHYYQSHKWINPTGIVPKGPLLDLDSAHDRGPVKFKMMAH
ncbi:MAG TPA: glutathione S-transferase family protein [Bacteriovoracaceae bacterium]|nr:glutathione S-transferase family protein [Bacteriovoracaceae bacterium]